MVEIEILKTIYIKKLIPAIESEIIRNGANAFAKIYFAAIKKVICTRLPNNENTKLL